MLHLTSFLEKKLAKIQREALKLIQVAFGGTNTGAFIDLMDGVFGSKQVWEDPGSMTTEVHSVSEADIQETEASGMPPLENSPPHKHLKTSSVVSS